MIGYKTNNWKERFWSILYKDVYNLACLGLLHKWQAQFVLSLGVEKLIIDCEARGGEYI